MVKRHQHLFHTINAGNATRFPGARKKKKKAGRLGWSFLTLLAFVPGAGHWPRRGRAGMVAGGEGKLRCVVLPAPERGVPIQLGFWFFGAGL